MVGSHCGKRTGFRILSEPSLAKTCLVVKEESATIAKDIFQGTGISITEEGKRHIGAAIGPQAFAESYVKQKVSEWVCAIKRLSSFAHTQPHAAYAAFTTA